MEEEATSGLTYGAVIEVRIQAQLRARESVAVASATQHHHHTNAGQIWHCERDIRERERELVGGLMKEHLWK